MRGRAAFLWGIPVGDCTQFHHTFLPGFSQFGGLFFIFVGYTGISSREQNKNEAEIKTDHLERKVIDMKQKYVAILLGAAMAMSTAGTTATGLTVMAEESVTENSTKSTTEAGNAAAADETAKKNDSGQDKEQDKNGKPEEDENQVRGEITAVGESSVTIKTDAGDETEISITDNTEITRQSMGAPGGQQGAPDSYDAANEYTGDAESDGESFVSTGTDENAVLVDSGAKVTIKNAQISRQSSDSTGGDNSSFYGIGAAVLAKDGAVNVSDSEITTDAAGAAGVFAYGDGTAYVSDTTITTQQDTSGGIHVAGGGTLYAWNVNAETSGESSAAIRSDRGGGTIVAEGGTYTSNGVGSPAIYSTADIAVSDAQLTANGSEAVCIEGLNSIHLFNSDLTGNMADDEQNDCTWNVILYQSMSGDSEVGNSTFEMEGGTLTAKNGGMFYTTNTESTFLLSGVDIAYADDSEFFLRCTGNENRRGWGSVGSNGADCLFTAKEQEMQGDVVWDSVSDLDFYMTGGSTLTGAVVDDESCAGEGGDGVCNFYISDDSTWVVTGDSTLTDLQCAGTITDENGNTVSVVGTDGTVYVDGDSEWTVTVESYEDTADLSGAAASTTWNDYAVDQQA